METTDSGSLHNATRHVYRRHVRFQVLGSLEVDVGNGPIPLGGPKQRAVLAHLLLRANQLVPATTLIDEVWGDEPPETARNTLQTYVSHLRKALGNGRIGGRPPGYQLEVGREELDAERFDDLVRDARKAMAIDPAAAVGVLDEALALWRGPAFADLADEPSLTAEAARLNELRSVAIEDRLDALLSSGEHARVVGEAEALVGRHPLRERLWGQLMTALYRAGRQAEALAAFQRAREVLADELGIDPSTELVHLHERILRQDPGLDLRGEPLRGYRLLERVEDGPRGVVYRAIQPKVERDVAVKILHARLASDPAFVRRFEADAQAVAALEHPHIVPIYDYWREPGGAYVVSRFLRGGSLAGLVARGTPLDRFRAARMIEQVASALAFANRQGIAHGNVCGTNVLFDPEGNAYLSDFRIGSPQVLDPRDDVVALARLMRDAVGGALPASVNELLERVEDGDTSVEPDAIGRAAGATIEPQRATPAVPDTDARNPYKGLRPFTQADAQDFFGREGLTRHLVDELADTVHDGRFLAVVGPSGSGKSSAVRAGVLPRLREGGLAGSEGWFVAEMFPGAHPIEELEAALLRIAIRPAARLLERLEASSRGLLEAVDLVVPGDAEVVLVVDQFEEVFTLTEDDTERDLFLESLRVAVADPSSRIRIVVTLRADFFDRPLQHPRFSDLLGARTVVVSPLTPDELERAISRPAEAVGVRTEPGLVADIVADVANQPGALPLVEFALTELFERRDAAERAMTLAAYRDIGGVTGALAARAEHLYRVSGPDGKKAAKQALLRLVTLGEGREDTRRRVTRGELMALEVETGSVEAVLDAFGRHRLLTFDREPSTREPTVEIAHEALLREWPRLRGWIDDAREDLRRSRLLTRGAAEWRGAEGDPSFLLVGSRLEQVEGWEATTDLAIGRAEREYLAASLAQRERDRKLAAERNDLQERLVRRSARRLRALVVVLTVAALVASVLTVIAVEQRRTAVEQASIAYARELAAAATANLDIDPERSLLLALEAVEATRGDGIVFREALEALHAGIQRDRLLFTITDPSTGNVAWSPNGSLLATGGSVGGNAAHDAMLWDARNGSLVHRLTGHTEDVSSVTFNPDGGLLATTADDGSTIVWDTATGDRVWSFTHPRDEHVAVDAFSPDGRLLAIGSNSGPGATGDPEIRVFDTSTWTLIRSFEGPGRPIFSGDGRTLRAGGNVWNMRTGRSDSSEPPYWDALPSPDGTLLAAVEGGNVHILDASPRHRELATLSIQSGEIFGLAWSPDGTMLATGGRDGVARVWDPRTERLLLELAGHTGLVGIVAFSPDGNRLFTGGGDGTARVWDVTPAGAAEWLATSTTTELGLTYRPDGALFSAGWGGGWFWDVPGGARTGNVPSTPTAAVDPTGATVLGWIPDTGRLAFLDASSGEVLARLPRDLASLWLTAAVYSPDGASLAIGHDDGTVSLWDVATGQQLAKLGPTIDNEPVMDVAFTPDGRTLAMLAHRGTFRAWSVPAGDLLVGRQTNTGLGTAIAFSPDGQQVAASGGDGAVVWPLLGSEPIATLAGGGIVNDVAFSPDGATLATVGELGTTKLWSTSTWDETLAIQGERPLDSVAIAPDGGALATADLSGVLRVYALRIDDLVAFAERSLSRGFTGAECRHYLHVASCPTPSPAPSNGRTPTGTTPDPEGPEGAYTVTFPSPRGDGGPPWYAGERWTLTLQDGIWGLTTLYEWGDKWSTSGSYEVTANEIRFTDAANPTCFRAGYDATWSLDGMNLSFDDVSASERPCSWVETVLDSRPWSRLGQLAWGG